MPARKIYRTLPIASQPWSRGGDLVRIKMIDLEAALPPGLKLEKIRAFRLIVHRAGHFQELPFHLDFGDGYGRWARKNRITPNTQICFTAPLAAEPATTESSIAHAAAEPTPPVTSAAEAAAPAMRRRQYEKRNAERTEQKLPSHD